MKFKIMALLCVATLAVAGPASALVVTTTDVGATLVNEIVGAGITVNAGSIVYNGVGTTASGTFTGGIASGIGIESGIILTSGNAADAIGPNSFDDTTTILGTGGDADLATLVPGTIFDAITLEFEFNTAGGDLFFNFVFASEEYNEWANTSFNDVFGFFLDGSNVAFITGTNTPVSVNNVNGGNPLGVNAMNPSLYNNNDLSDGGPFFDIEYDGFTDVFQVQVFGLDAGLHTIKLAISDTGDQILDSAVFIQGGTFKDTPTPIVPEPATIMLLGFGLAGAGLRARKQRV